MFGKRLFKTLANAWKVPELRKKLLYTLLLLVIFRFGAHITAPGVDVKNLERINELTVNVAVHTELCKAENDANFIDLEILIRLNL